MGRVSIASGDVLQDARPNLLDIDYARHEYRYICNESCFPGLSESRGLCSLEALKSQAICAWGDKDP